MTAINAVANENLKAVYQAPPQIIASVDKGSVITNDHCVGILVKLCVKKEYAEMAFPIINAQNNAVFIHTLTTRLPKIEKDSKRKRVEKILKKIH